MCLLAEHSLSALGIASINNTTYIIYLSMFCNNHISNTQLLHLGINLLFLFLFVTSINFCFDSPRLGTKFNDTPEHQTDSIIQSPSAYPFEQQILHTAACNTINPTYTIAYMLETHH